MTHLTWLGRETQFVSVEDFYNSLIFEVRLIFNNMI